MTTPQGNDKDLLAEKFEAEVREADASLKALQAQAQARTAKADMDEISGLAAAKERVKKNIADMKQQASADRAAAKQEVEKSIKELQVGIQRVNERYTAWDTARERRFYARLDEADAKLAAWKARGDQKRADFEMKQRDDFSTLEERIALARASAAKAASEKYSAKSQAALDEAARYFDEAYDAAAKRYGSV